MRMNRATPEWAGAIAAVLAFAGWELLLHSMDQPIWQQGVDYLGEVLFGFTAADLLWSAAGRRRVASGGPAAGDGRDAFGRWATVSAAGLALWPAALAVAAVSGLDRHACVTAAAILLIVVRFVQGPWRLDDDEEEEEKARTA